jgi:hypothetical protein
MTGTSGADAGKSDVNDGGAGNPESAGETSQTLKGGRESSGVYGGSGGNRVADAGEGGAGVDRPQCGNGSVEELEDCDDGRENGPGKYCNSDCIENICGDGDRSPREGCDDGEGNGLELLRCAPDCSRIIEIKHIVIAPYELTNEILRPDPIAKADAECPVGYKALFAYGTRRRATITPFKSESGVDWVLRPFTYYVNSEENLVWITRDVPLLGVADGQFFSLANPITRVTRAFVSNLNIDGTSLLTDNCDGWAMATSQYSKHVGLGLVTDAGYLDYDLIECGHYVSFYCVEQ